MIDRLCFFEDGQWRAFGPVALTRPVSELLVGMSSLREKVERKFPGVPSCLLTRDYLADKLRRTTGVPVNDGEALSKGTTLFVNGRIGAPIGLSVEELSVGKVYRQDGQIVAACLGAAAAAPLRAAVGQPLGAEVWAQVANEAEVVDLPAGTVTVFNELYELMLDNGRWIVDEFPLYATDEGGGTLEPGVFIRGDRSQLYVGQGAVVQSGVVLDVTEGPIYLSADTTVKPPTVIAGPTFVGKKSLVDGAKIREDTSLGPVCKVGGEVEASILLGYSNKHHDGFLGHAYVGEWVNLGALVTNSDLKNNYGSVKVQRWTTQPAADSGETFIGCTIGDHTKLGIGVMVTTGATLGMCVNWTGADIVPRCVPSFMWHTPGDHTEYRLDKAAQTAAAVMARRKLEFDEVEQALLQACYDLTAKERAAELGS